MRFIFHYSLLLLFLPVCSTIVAGGAEEGVVVEVDAGSQNRYGIVTELLKSAEYRPGLEAFGEVIDHGPLLQQWNDCRVTELAEASERKEYDRLKMLNSAGKFSSDHVVELAESALEAVSLQAKLAKIALSATWGIIPGSGGPTVDEGLLESLMNRQSALLRVSVPPTQLLPPDAGKIWLSPPVDPSQRSVLKDYWMDPKVSLQKSPGFIGVIDLDERLWPIGLGLVGRIETAGDPVTGLLLPASAVVYWHGTAWAYQKTSGESFQQVQVDISKPQDLGWFVSGKGMDPKLPMVVQGAQAILAQQLQAAVGAEDEE